MTAGASSGTLASFTLLGLGATLGLLLWGILRHPASVGRDGALGAGALIVGLTSYVLITRWAQRRHHAAADGALATGAHIGRWLGAVALVGHTLEVLADLPSGVMATLGVGTWGLMFLLFSAAGSVTYRRSGSPLLAIVASTWAAIVSTTMTVAFGFAVSLMFMPRMRAILHDHYAGSGMTDVSAFVVRSTIMAATLHVWAAPVIGAAFGGAGAITAGLLKNISRNKATALAVVAVALILGGVASIRAASRLHRSRRPPFVMAGLGALGLALVAAHPLCVAVRRSALQT
jgi:hypothetical protein